MPPVEHPQCLPVFNTCIEPCVTGAPIVTQVEVVQSGDQLEEGLVNTLSISDQDKPSFAVVKVGIRITIGK